MEKLRERTSTILPLPSSPHWAPTMTAVLPRFTGNAHSSPVTIFAVQMILGKGRESLLLKDFNREAAGKPSGHRGIGTSENRKPKSHHGGTETRRKALSNDLLARVPRVTLVRHASVQIGL